MSTHYVAIQPRAWVSATDAPETRPTCEVFEADAKPIDTGLLNADGLRLYRIQPRAPLGFCRNEATA